MKTITVKTKSGKQTEYSVNEQGKGLWENGKQIAGHADFTANSPSELMRKLKSDGSELKMVRGSAINWQP